MSFNSQMSSFSKQLQAQAAMMPKRAVSNNTSTANSSTNGKRKLPSGSTSTTSSSVAARKPTDVYSQPADTALQQGGNYMTQVHYVVQYLKDKETPQTPKQISGYLNYELNDTLKYLLKKNERIHYDPRSDTFLFRPIHNIRTKEALVSHLRGTTTAQGLLVKELKDGWAGAVEAITQLEAEREILVTRTKKDNQPRMVWINDKSLDLEVDDEFKEIWNKITLPPAAEIPGLLTKYGLKPTSVDPATIKATTTKSERKRPKVRRAGRVTNTHLAGVLKDYAQK